MIPRGTILTVLVYTDYRLFVYALCCALCVCVCVCVCEQVSEEYYRFVGRWVCIYPAYLNARKTIAQGRRIPRNKSVDNPLCSEIRDVCLSQQLKAEVEQQKHYPREPSRDHIHSGRVRVQLKDVNGQPLSENIKSSELLSMT